MNSSKDLIGPTDARDDISHIFVIRYVDKEGNERGPRRLMLPESASRYVRGYNNLASQTWAEARRLDLPDLAGDFAALEYRELSLSPVDSDGGAETWDVYILRDGRFKSILQMGLSKFHAKRMRDLYNGSAVAGLSAMIHPHSVLDAAEPRRRKPRRKAAPPKPRIAKVG